MNDGRCSICGVAISSPDAFCWSTCARCHQAQLLNHFEFYSNWTKDESARALDHQQADLERLAARFPA